MKITMNIENVALTMSQPSQVSLRLGAILDGKRRRRPLRRATIVSALLIAASAVPLLAAAQTKSDLLAQTTKGKVSLQYRFMILGRPILLVTPTRGPVTLTSAKTTKHKNFIDIAVPNGEKGEVVFFANTIRAHPNQFVLDGKAVITVRDDIDSSKTLFQFKAEKVTVQFPPQNRR